MLETVREFVQQYVQRGFAVCRLRSGEKCPGYKQWNLKVLQPDDFQKGDNVGFITGRLSGDLVCVDLDSPHAIQLADDFLPHTDMVDGRPGKPRAHRWYHVFDIPEEMTSKASGGMGGPVLKHFRDTGGVNLLDFLGTGGQAVVSPSLHNSGEQRIWHSEGEPG